MNRRKLVIIAVSLVFYAVTFFVKEPLLYIVTYLVAGHMTLIQSARNIVHGQIFDENFLMAVASIGALVLGEYSEGIAVMIFYNIGEFFEDYAVNRSRRSIKDLLELAPTTANRITPGGTVEEIDPYDIAVGDRLLVKAGEKIPTDGIVIEGSASVDMSPLTGEPVPVDIGEGEEILSGCIDMTGAITVEATHLFEDATVSKILEMVENASSKKASTEKFITVFAKYYTPIVVFGAVALALIPPLCFGQEFSEWIYRALMFLVISCPCALVISVPLSFFGGIGACSGRGILVKGSNYLQMLASCDAFLFDKTGTLTTGKFEVKSVTGEKTLSYAAAIESYSSHPIAKSVADAYNGDKLPVSDVTEIPGKGLKGICEGKELLAGNRRFLEESGVKGDFGEGTVYVALDGELLGGIVIGDRIKDGAAEMIAGLKKAGVKRLVMMTGDKEDNAQAVAGALGLDSWHSGLLPADKVSFAEEEIERNKVTCFIGDGINDAPVLARADVGISMGGSGFAAAIEASDMVIMDDDLRKVPLAIRIARKTVAIAKENIVFALSVKVILLVLGAFGLINMWIAVFGDVGVAIIAILNSMRVLAGRYAP